MCDYLRCVLQRITVRANEPPRFHTFYFLFFLFQEREDSLTYKFAGGKMVWIPVTFKVGTLPEENEENSGKKKS